MGIIADSSDDKAQRDALERVQHLGNSWYLYQVCQACSNLFSNADTLDAARFFAEHWFDSRGLSFVLVAQAERYMQNVGKNPYNRVTCNLIAPRCNRGGREGGGERERGKGGRGGGDATDL